MKSSLPSIIIAPLLLAGCALGPDFALPGLSAGGTWKQSTSMKGTALPDEWWRLFRDAELNRLVQRAIDANPDIAAARARRDTARALVGVDRARLFPRLDVNSSTGIDRNSANGAFPIQNLENQSYRAGFDFSYDLDLWGSNRRSIEAAEAEASAADALLAAQRLGIASEVARQYFTLRGLDAQEAILNETIASREEALSLEKSRNDAGLTDGLSTSRARTEVERAKNDLALIQRRRGSTEHALAVLCGTRPGAFSVSKKNSTAALPRIAPGLPAEVLARRPDMRAAEQSLRAANARIGVAEAAFYPDISLTGSAGLDSVDASSFLQWESRVLSLGAGLAAPLLDGGTNRANYDASRSRYEESLARYRQTMLVALREVEDALVDLQGLGRSRRALDAALDSAGETRKLSFQRYDKGLSSYFEVVEADRDVLQIRLALAEVDAQQRVSLAALAAALGGGWDGK
ncbi:MAG: efflux transporter outer membrane subunit [Akkermansiaceae bacterium]|jgi:multidrug efflux system outer membrane protein|nr:efflux transporter outer membrane subunit [Akkermansiaceae bacterium]